MLRTRIAAAFIVASAGFAAFPAVAHATGSTTNPNEIESRCNKGWYVNPDENGSDPKQGDRRPTQTKFGFAFKGNQLMHRATSLDVKDLKPGSFKASPAPSLSSFFSVEVRNADGSGYGTLRWNTATSKWDIVVAGTLYSDADPLKLVTERGKSTHVFSFGVGYVNSPNNGTPTVVREVSFMGQRYGLTCFSRTPTATPTTVKPTTTKPTTTQPTTTQPTARPCEAYVYTGTRTNLCADFPGRADVACPEVKFQVTLTDNAKDPWDLDGIRGGSRGVIGLGCESFPKKNTTATPPTTRPTTPAPTTTAPVVDAVGNNSDSGSGGLPVTGAPVALMAGLGIAVVVAGITGIVLVRRRATRFEG